MLAGGYRTDEAPPGTSLRDWRSRWMTQRIAEEVRLTPLSASRHGAGDDADPRYRAPRAARGRGGRLRADGRHPAPHRGAARCAERGSSRERAGDSRGDRARHDRGRGAGAACRIDRPKRRPSPRPARSSAAASARMCWPGSWTCRRMRSTRRSRSSSTISSSIRLGCAGSSTSGTSSCAMPSTAACRSPSGVDSTRVPANSGRSLEGQSEIHSSLHYERAGMRRRAFDAALAGARDAARLSAHREAFELYRRAIDNMPDDIGPSGRGRDPRRLQQGSRLDRGERPRGTDGLGGGRRVPRGRRAGQGDRLDGSRSLDLATRGPSHL